MRRKRGWRRTLDERLFLLGVVETCSILQVEHFVDISRIEVSDIPALINSNNVHVLIDICGLHANGTMLYKR